MSWPRTVAGAAGAAHGKETLLIDHFAASVAGGAGGGARPGFGALAAGSGLHCSTVRHLDFRADAEDGVLEADFQIVADVFAALRPVAPPLAAAPEQVAEAEEIAENIREIRERVGIEPAAAGAQSPGGRTGRRWRASADR